MKRYSQIEIEQMRFIPIPEIAAIRQQSETPYARELREWQNYPGRMPSDPKGSDPDCERIHG